MNRYHFALRIPLVRQSRGTQFLIAAGSHTDWCWFFFLLLFRMNAKKTLYSNSLSKIWGHAQWFCCSYEYNFSLFHKYVLLCLRWRGMVGSVIFLFFKYLPQSNSRKTVTHKWLHKTPAHFPICVVYWSQWIIMSFFLLYFVCQIANWQASKMSSERQPLLSEAEPVSRTNRIRPDFRNSPDNTLVDVQSEDDGKCFLFSCFDLIVTQFHLTYNMICAR